MMAGMLWTKIAPVLRALEIDANSARGEKVMWAGTAMFAAGFALLYLWK
ncbi:MAG: hypothetical protein JWL69_4077 [Phycisphaerales bacterium]|nr:hypothetical protein [Phycisphaerales bacterium]MDB5355129.1 hypothetical protein [Phycisphaerales bacterium]